MIIVCVCVCVYTRLEEAVRRLIFSIYDMITHVNSPAIHIFSWISGYLYVLRDGRNMCTLQGHTIYQWFKCSTYNRNLQSNICTMWGHLNMDEQIYIRCSCRHPQVTSVTNAKKSRFFFLPLFKKNARYKETLINQFSIGRSTRFILDALFNYPDQLQKKK